MDAGPLACWAAAYWCSLEVSAKAYPYTSGRVKEPGSVGGDLKRMASRAWPGPADCCSPLWAGRKTQRNLNAAEQ
ncbi:hypothetical protein NDU88_010439 [Pleurodeles waltl]|uniref:Secreted protein n=1 Tax=Pleurodeles waltl TaxID=8319 RepID=A0AAV7QXI9_PLEWA|nr:hypothetical protein NDU88_010439 [Pleurodeles waltl]